MKSSLRLKIIFFTIIPIVTIYVVVHGWGFFEMQGRARLQVEDRMTELAWRYANQFDAYFRELGQIARSTAAFMAVYPQIGDADIYRLLRANLRQNPLIYGSAVAFAPNQRGPDKRLFSPYVYRDSSDLVAMDIAAEGYDYTQPRWSWWTLPSQTLEPVWTEPYLDEGAGNVEMVTYAVPFEIDGVFAGVATIDLRLRSLAALVNPEIALEREFVILTRTGKFVYSAEQHPVGTDILSMDAIRQQPELVQLVQAITSGGFGVEEFTDPKTGMEELAFFAPIKSTGWGFGARIYKREALAHIYAQALQIVAALLLSLALIILSVWLAARRITRPIAELTRATQAVAAGDLNTRLAVNSGDEIGVLSRSFGNMACKLAQREQALCRARDELEERVAVRTRDLAEANANLHREIEDRRRAAAALRKSEERFRILFEASSEANLLADEGGTLDCNQALLDLFGLVSKSGLTGRLIFELAPECQADGEPSLQYATRMLAEVEAKGHHRFDFLFSKASGETFPAEVLMTPVTLENKSVHIAVIHDLTHRKRAEDEIVRARDAAEAANRAKSEFLSNMSHELRTPLNGVLGYAQILQRDASVTASQRESLDAIESCGQHLLTLINDVLDISKIESGGLEIDPKTCDFVHLLDEVHDIVKPRAEAKGLRLAMDVDPDLPRAIEIDATKLRQVLINLLGNAVKFTRQGFVLLRVRETGEQRLGFEVEDTGVGIAADKIDDIFDPFKQTEEGVNAGGTGLGLAISARLVEAMGGGRLQVDSEPGRGSSFSFSLPLVEVDAEVFKEEDEQFAANANGYRHPVLAEGQEIWVLIVDDQAENRDILRRLLQTAGFLTAETADGKQALDKLEQHDYQVVLMDIRMPVMDGLEATREIRRRAHLRKLVVIAVTASVFPDMQSKIREAGCDDFIGKPLRAAELFGKIERYLGVRFVESGAQLSAPSAVEPRRPSQLDGSEIHQVARRLQASAEVGDVAALNQIARELAQIQGLGEISAAVNRAAKNFDFEQLETLAQVLAQSAS